MQKHQFTDKIELFFKTNRKIILFVSMMIATFFAVLLFEMKISTGEDDASYILSAQKFIDGETFPNWHGSFYPIFLSFFLRIFGLNLLILKIVSFVMIISHIFIIYYAFRLKIPWTILLGTIIYTSVCLEILYFAGQTYSEALFLLLQISTIAAFYRLYDINKEFPNQLKKQWKAWLIFGFLMFLLSITRNVGWSMIIAVIIYFLIEKKFRQILFTILSVAFFYIPYNIYKSVYWKVGEAGFEGQFEKMFWIDPYNVNVGKEDLSGFISRFIENSEQYLSKHFLIVLGWKDSLPTSTLVTVLIYLAFIFAAIVIFKKRRELLMPIIYVGIAIGITFVSQQTLWDQIRLILIYVPISVLLFSTALWDFLSSFKRKNLKIFVVFLLLLIIIPSLGKIISISKKHIPMLKANIEGDILYGYSPDWQHYFQMAEWTANNIPENDIVACRKPGMAYVYGNGRKFAGIYNLESYQIEDVISQLKNDTINTQHYAFDYIAEGENFYTLYPYFDRISAIISQDNGTQYIILSLDNETNTDFVPVLNSSNVKYTKLDSLENILITTRDADYAVYPDSLLNFLQEREIKYLIVAQLRKFPEKKSVHFITTIYRYVYFIELKYPGIFDLIWQIGKNDDEPAMLLKINYPDR